MTDDANIRDLVNSTSRRRDAGSSIKPRHLTEWQWKVIGRDDPERQKALLRHVPAPIIHAPDKAHWTIVGNPRGDTWTIHWATQEVECCGQRFRVADNNSLPVRWSDSRGWLPIIQHRPSCGAEFEAKDEIQEGSHP